jgi:hypothetical protein
MWGCVGSRLTARVAAALFVLPGVAFAQGNAGQNGSPGPRPGVHQAPHLLPPTSNKSRTDVLDLRDRHEPPVPVTPLAAASGIVCVAGCGTGPTPTALGLPAQSAPILAVVGPLENANIVKAAVVAPPAAVAPAVADSGVITCLAGCDATDRRVMAATGGPLPTYARHNLPPRLLTAAVTPRLQQPAKPAVAKAPALAAPARVASAPVAPPAAATSSTAAPLKLKRTYAAHVKRKEKKAVLAAARKVQPSVQPAGSPLPKIAAVGVPTPIQPTQPNQKPVPAVAKPQPIVSPKRPVAVSTSSDWFNKINREQAAKKKADDAQ